MSDGLFDLDPEVSPQCHAARHGACVQASCQCGCGHNNRFAAHVDGLAPAIRIDGDTYDPSVDAERLGTQAKAVFLLMRDERWRTLREIADSTGYPEASVSARLRDFRKQKFGGNEVERRRRTVGLWEYRLFPARAEWRPS